MDTWDERLKALNEALLNEGRDAPLFHWTREQSLFNIISSDYLTANPSNVPMGVSTSRNLNTIFFNNRFAVLILNQSKLAQRYKIVPLYGDSPVQMRANEQEERIITAKLDDVHKYITAIGIDSSVLAYGSKELSDVVSDSWQLVGVMLLAAYATKHHIPIVDKKSISKNGAWSKDITAEIKAVAKKIKAVWDAEEPEDRTSNLLSNFNYQKDILSPSDK
jgi:hypothetical protein